MKLSMNLRAKTDVALFGSSHVPSLMYGIVPFSFHDS